jgi:hypothetical protein
VDWWPADGNPDDIFGYKNGTPQNGFSYSTGKSGLAFHFDGSSSYLTVPGGSSIQGNWTACMWVNRQNSPSGVAAMMSDGTNELKLEQYSTNAIPPRQVGFTHFGVNDWSFAYTVPQNSWTHLAFVASGTQTFLYANGSLVSTVSTNIPLPRAYLGAGYYAVSSPAFFVDYMLGSLDEILLFNRALSSSEISAIYSAGSAGMVRAPEFTGTASYTNGQLKASLKGQTGKSFTIHSSTDLKTWTVFSALSNPTGTAQFTDAAATNSPQKFYRASQ